MYPCVIRVHTYCQIFSAKWTLFVTFMTFTGRILSSHSIPSLEGGMTRPLSTEPPKIATDGKENSELYIHMLDSQLPYGHEFYGCDVSLALTPMTERCFLTLTQVISG